MYVERFSTNLPYKKMYDSPRLEINKFDAIGKLFPVLTLDKLYFEPFYPREIGTRLSGVFFLTLLEVCL